MMTIHALDIASSLGDDELLRRLATLAGSERQAAAELVAHLAALDDRPSVYAAEGHGSLFAYCTQALRLSEDAACNRIEAARACRSFPVILEHVASGSLSLTTVRRLRAHLTPENHEAVIAKALGRSRREVEVLIAHLAPKPDAPTIVRKLPLADQVPAAAAEAAVDRDGLDRHLPMGAGPDVGRIEAAGTATVPTPTPRASPRAMIQPTSPQRYRLQFTIGEAAHDRLRRLQALLRREIPDGDPGAIVDRALVLLLDDVERRKLGAVKSARRRPIRPGTDGKARVEPPEGTEADSRAERMAAGGEAAEAADAKGIEPTADMGGGGGVVDLRTPPPDEALDTRTPPLPSRTVPRAVRRSAWSRDAGRCGYVSAAGQRCTERTFLEFHHVWPHARRGEATVENISLRCRRHNQYEAEVVFGPRPEARGSTAPIPRGLARSP